MSRPTFSIVIPCFNDGKYLGETIRSVESQTFKEWEIILVDDGSTDALTQKLLTELATQTGIHLIQTSHVGPAQARNIAIEKSIGTYILPLDADDLVDKTYLQKANDFFKSHQQKSIFYTRAKFFGKAHGSWNLPEFELTKFAFENCIYASAVYPKEMWSEVGGYNPNMVHGLEDYDFWIKSISKGYVPFRHQEELFSYRIKENSRSVQLFIANRELEMLRTLVGNNLGFFSRPEILIETYVQMKRSQKELKAIHRSFFWRVGFQFLLQFEMWLRGLRSKITGRGDFF